jgi:hypothetical protein
VLTAPTSARQLEQDLAEIAKGPLPDEEMAFLREYGDAVHRARRWFM